MKDSISENTGSTGSVNPSNKQDPLSDEAFQEYADLTVLDMDRAFALRIWQECARRARDLQDRICEEQQDWIHIELQEEVKHLRELLKEWCYNYEQGFMRGQAQCYKAAREALEGK